MPRKSAKRLAAVIAALATTTLLAAGCAGGSNAAGGGAVAEDYPTKDINFIVQAAAGGGSDLTSRALAKELEPILGKSIVVWGRSWAPSPASLDLWRSPSPQASR